MSEIHDLLWNICRKLPSDFSPYGQRDRDSAEPCADCSCGCRHFLPLEDKLGNDWGVCGNPKSPRAGLLTFEHQGCPAFESSELEYANVVSPSDLADHEVQPAQPRRKLKVDLNELTLALEGYGGDDTHYYLDMETGEILSLNEEFEETEELSDRIETGPDGRYEQVEKLPSHENFRMMEIFAEDHPNLRWKTRMLDALARDKPFRSFKDAVHSQVELKTQWYAYRDASYIRRATDWLKTLGIEVEM